MQKNIVKAAIRNLLLPIRDLPDASANLPSAPSVDSARNCHATGSGDDTTTLDLTAKGLRRVIAMTNPAQATATITS